jgi:hypothetical protein
MLDWTNPDTWKAPAALIEHWQQIAGGSVVILGAGGTLLKWGFRPFRWAWSKIPSRKSQLVTVERPLRFVQNEHQSFWGPAGSAARPGTQVAGRWHVTNTSDRNVVLLRVRLDGYSCEGHVHTFGFRDRAYSSITPIPAESMALMTVNFMCYPPIISGIGPLVVELIFTDNYEHEHRVPSRFRFIRA